MHSPQDTAIHHHLLPPMPKRDALLQRSKTSLGFAEKAVFPVSTDGIDDEYLLRAKASAWLRYGRSLEPIHPPPSLCAPCAPTCDSPALDKYDFMSVSGTDAPLLEKVPPFTKHALPNFGRGKLRKTRIGRIRPYSTVTTSSSAPRGWTPVSENAGSDGYDWTDAQEEVGYGKDTAHPHHATLTEQFARLGLQWGPR